MKKLTLLSLAFVFSMASAALASPNLEAYETCWAKASTDYLDRNGVTADTLSAATLNADTKCAGAKSDILRANNNAPVPELDEMRQYMEVQLYNANPVEGPAVASAQPEQPPQAASKHPYGVLYNTGPAFLCDWASDVTNMRQLVQQGRLELARQVPGCVVVEHEIELEQISRFGEALKVRVIHPSGKMSTAWTSAIVFRTEAYWN